MRRRDSAPPALKVATFARNTQPFAWLLNQFYALVFVAVMCRPLFLRRDGFSRVVGHAANARSAGSFAPRRVVHYQQDMQACIDFR
jgi:hypothetical protein